MWFDEKQRLGGIQGQIPLEDLVKVNSAFNTHTARYEIYRRKPGFIKGGINMPKRATQS